ncbi:MAG: TonB-dependent receptor [Sphingobacteriales bacterium]|nr:TonB-dependent receptor [Sphingobacteriales bacterium]
MLHKLTYLYLLVIIGLNSYSQNCTIKITGRVLDEHDRSALSFANIYILELQTGTAADEKGNFEFSGICPGTYSFVIDHIGCSSDTVIWSITQNTNKDFYLEHHAEELAEIISTASRTNGQNSQNTTVLDIKTLHKLEGKDLGTILSTISGVNQLKTGSTVSKPVIHGLYGDRISIISNGVKLETQDWGTEHAPEIDPMASNTVKVIKGAGSLEYGTDALGGMILLEPPVLQKNQHLKAGFSLVGQTNGRGIITSAKIEQGFKKQIAYFVQGTYKRLGDGQAPHYNLTNTGLQEGNLSAGIGVLKKNWDINAFYSLYHQDLGILRSSHIGNLTDLENAIESDTPLIVKPFNYNIENPKQDVYHHLAKINIIKYFSNQSHLDVTYSLQVNKRKEFDIRRGGRSEIPALDMQLWSHNLLGTYSRFKRFDSKDISMEGKSGFNFLTKHNFNNSSTGIRPLIPDYYQYGIGIFDMEKIQLQHFTLEFGGRYDYTRFLALRFDNNNVLQKPVYNFHTYAFTIGGSWKNTSGNMRLQNNLSFSSRFPNASELFSDGLHHGIAVLEFGNANLKPEKGIKWVSTFTASYKKYIQAEATFYISKIYDFIYLAPLPKPIVTIRGAFPAFQYYQTDARLLGLDITISSEPIDFLSLFLKSSIGRGKNTSINDHLIYMPADRISAGFELHHDFKKIRHVHLGMNVQHTFKQKNTPVLIADYKATPNAYTVLNADAGFDFVLNEHHSLSFSVTGENITNTVYRDYMNRFRYYSDEPGWNLTFRIRYSFTKS